MTRPLPPQNRKRINCLDVAFFGELYFEEQDAAGKPYTIPGLARALGFGDRRSFPRYAQDPDYAEVMGYLRSRIEEQRNEALIQHKGNPAGIIFDLKNNFGWVDKVEWAGTMEHTHDVSAIRQALDAIESRAVVLDSRDVPALEGAENDGGEHDA